MLEYLLGDDGFVERSVCHQSWAPGLPRLPTKVSRARNLRISMKYELAIVLVLVSDPDAAGMGFMATHLPGRMTASLHSSISNGERVTKF